MTGSLWTARILVSPAETGPLMERWEGFLPAPSAVSAIEKSGGEWWVEALYEHEPDIAILERQLGRAVTLAGLKGENWVARSLEGLKPVRAGRFIVFGAHDAPSVPINLVRLQIEASLAFGSGHHDTTRGCLLAIDRWLKQHTTSKPKSSWPGLALEGEQALKRRVVETNRWRSSCLDIGTGSGVLALALAKATRRKVIATDIDPVAVQVTRANARANGAHRFIAAVTANGLAHRAVARSAPYALAVANILADPLARLAPQILARAGRGATIILSGILTTQARSVLGAYRSRDCMLERRLALGEWTTLVLRVRRHARRRR